jgi:transcriptional regulatory protein RtcR
MATLAEDGMMDGTLVRAETARLAQEWRELDRSPGDEIIERYLGSERAHELDRFDRVQLAEVLRVCENSRMLSEAGRTLFEVSRKQRARVNDADRLRKYLAAFGLSFEQISREVTGRRAAGRSSAT